MRTKKKQVSWVLSGRNRCEDQPQVSLLDILPKSLVSGLGAFLSMVVGRLTEGKMKEIQPGPRMFLSWVILFRGCPKRMGIIPCLKFWILTCSPPQKKQLSHKISQPSFKLWVIFRSQADSLLHVRAQRIANKWLIADLIPSPFVWRRCHALTNICSIFLRSKKNSWLSTCAFFCSRNSNFCTWRRIFFGNRNEQIASASGSSKLQTKEFNH